MAISKRGNYENPRKSPWNFEKYDSDLERRMMDRLERDPHVAKWMKRHGVTIPWIDGQKHQRRYVPDFLVQYEDGRKAVSRSKTPVGLIPTTCSASAKLASAKLRKCDASNAR